MYPPLTFHRVEDVKKNTNVDSEVFVTSGIWRILNSTVSKLSSVAIDATKITDVSQNASGIRRMLLSHHERSGVQIKNSKYRTHKRNWIFKHLNKIKNWEYIFQGNIFVFVRLNFESIVFQWINTEWFVLQHTEFLFFFVYIPLFFTGDQSPGKERDGSPVLAF